MGCPATRALETALVDGADAEEIRYGQAFMLAAALTCLLILQILAPLA